MNELNFKKLERERIDSCPCCGNPVFNTPPIEFNFINHDESGIDEIFDTDAG